MDQQSAAEALRQFEAAWEETRTAFLAAQDDFADKLASARQTLRSCAGNVEKHKANLEQLTDHNRSRLDELRGLIAAGGDTAGLQERITALEAELAEKTGVAEAATTAKQEEEKRASAAEQRVRELEAELVSARELAAEKGRVLEGVEKELAAAKKELETADATSGAKVQTLEASELALRGELATVQGELELARGRTEELHRSLAAVEAELAALKADKDGARTELEAALAARMDLQAEVDRLQAVIAQSDSKEKAHEDAMADLRAELHSERKRADLAEHTLKDEMAKGTKASLAAQLAEAIREAEEAKDELRTLKLSTGLSPSASVAPGATAPSNRRAVDDELAAIAAVLARGKSVKRAIGELLVEADILTKEQVSQAVDEQRKRPQTHLGAIFIEHEWCSEEAVAQALAFQCGAEYKALDADAVDAAAVALINERLANQHVCIPLSASEDTVTLAIANPMDLVAIEDIERATGRKVDLVVSTATQIKAAIGRQTWEA